MIELLLPVGRMVRGDLYDAQQRTDPVTQKPVFKADGTPESSFYFAIGIPKGPEQHWNQTPWGAQIWADAEASWGPMIHNPKFAFKIQDGDSQIPNTKGKRNCDVEGYPGNWIINFSTQWAPEIYNENGTVRLIEKDAVKPGYYIQVYASIKTNASTQSPGMYMNPMGVALIGYGPVITISSMDATAVGFGQGPRPAGISPVPLGNTSPTQMAANVGPGQGGVGFAPPSIPPVPNPAILNVPKPKVMTPLAGGNTYEQMLQAGWDDALLIQHGMMLP